MTEYSEGQPFLGIPKDDGSQNPPPVYYDRSSTPTMVSKKSRDQGNLTLLILRLQLYFLPLSLFFYQIAITMDNNGQTDHSFIAYDLA